MTLNKKTDTTQYLWDINMGLPQVLTESDGKGTALYTYGLSRISMADPRKGQMYYQYDGLGSVRSLTDRKGTTKGLYAYDAFGKPLLSASHVDNDFQYTGEQVDEETGLIYLRSRYYDPEIGRFISRDSFPGFDTSTQSLNRYTYVQNNPVVYTDPSGKVAPAVAVAVRAIAAAATKGAIIGAGMGFLSQYTSDIQSNWAAGKTGINLIQPSSSPETYRSTMLNNAAIGAATFGIAPAAKALSTNIPILESIMPPLMSSGTAFAGYYGTDLVKSKVNGKPLDTTAARSDSLRALGQAYPGNLPASLALNLPYGASLIAGPEATNNYWDKFSGVKGEK